MLVELENNLSLVVDGILRVERYKSTKWKDRKEPFRLKFEYLQRERQWEQEWCYANMEQRDNDYNVLKGLIK